MSKASKLSVLKRNSFNVPDFIFVKSPNYKLPFKTDKYIVRSSFDIEDSDKSFAGVFKSYGPIEEHEIKFYLQKVLCGTTAATLYHEKSGLQKKMTPGAIIQQYLPSDYGGVCFTDHNSTIIVETGKNAEEVTSGKRIGSTYKISRFSLNIKNIPDSIIALVADALDIEAIFKKPQDIEWLEHQKIYILQAREAKKTGDRRLDNLKEFLSIIPPSIWDRYLAFSFTHSDEFQKTAYQLTQKILRLELFNWESIMRKSYRKPNGNSKIETFKDAVVNYGYYGFLNQMSESDSLAMRRINLSAKRLGLSDDILLDYAINRKKSIYSKIIDNPKQYDETFAEDITISSVKEKKKRPKLHNFSKREKRVADFFALLYDIKGYGVVYHDYKISPILKQAYENIPNHMKDGVTNYIEILEKQGFSAPNIERDEQIRPSYSLPQSLIGNVGKEILVYKNVTPEAVLKLKDVKCIISEEGGILSHAAILAKEFDIPFIAGIKNAAKLLEKGDRLHIQLNKNHILIKNETKNTELKVEAE